MFFALPRTLAAVTSKTFCRSATVAPSMRATLNLSFSKSALTGPSQEPEIPSRKDATWSRTLRRALYKGPRPAPEARPQLPPLLSSRAICVSDQLTTLSS